MRKIVVLMLFVISTLFAQKVEVSADKLVADESSHISKLIGNVKIKKGSDTISANELSIKFNDKNKPLFYEAKGDIKFHIYTQKREFEGSANSLTYDPKTLKYELSGNVKVHEKSQDQTLEGERVVIDRISGRSEIDGGSKPVKFIFDVKE